MYIQTESPVQTLSLSVEDVRLESAGDRWFRLRLEFTPPDPGRTAEFLHGLDEDEQRIVSEVRQRAWDRFQETSEARTVAKLQSFIVQARTQLSEAERAVQVADADLADPDSPLDVQAAGENSTMSRAAKKSLESRIQGATDKLANEKIVAQRTFDRIYKETFNQEIAAQIARADQAKAALAQSVADQLEALSLAERVSSRLGNLIRFPHLLPRI
jgi:hypothetical protein